MDVRVEVAERLHLEVREEALDLVDAAEEHGHDHHRAGALGDAVAEVEARQPARRHERRHEPLDEEHRELARGERARGGPRPSPVRRPRRRRRAGVSVRGDDAEAGQQADAAEVDRGGVGERPNGGAARPRRGR